MTAIATQCCIVGGGPAGMMLGFLLARSGVRSVVLEKHGDFLRDFRGDTVHPSTLNVMDELGLLDDFLKLPHQEVSRFGAQFGEEHVQVADFSHLPVRCGFIALMPQWDFLDFLAAHKPDLVAMDCMSYTPTTKEWVKGPLGVPALLAITATGRVLREMLE